MKFLQTNPLIEASGVQVFEALINKKLPADFVRFLIEHNGGEKPLVDGFKTESGESSMVSTFFGLGLTGSHADLATNYEYFRSTLPVGHIPIGSDIGGNLLTLQIGPESGVFLWDHDYPLAEQRPVRCSTSFQSFLDELYNSW